MYMGVWAKFGGLEMSFGRRKLRFWGSKWFFDNLFIFPVFSHFPPTRSTPSDALWRVLRSRGCRRRGPPPQKGGQPPRTQNCPECRRHRLAVWRRLVRWRVGWEGGRWRRCRGSSKVRTLPATITARLFALPRIAAFFGPCVFFFLGGLAFRAHHLFENKS